MFCQCSTSFQDSLIIHPQAPHPMCVRSSEFIANISILPRLAQLLVLVQGQMVVLHSLSALEILTRHQEIKLHWTCSMRECSTKKRNLHMWESPRMRMRDYQNTATSSFASCNERSSGFKKWIMGAPVSRPALTYSPLEPKMMPRL